MIAANELLPSIEQLERKEFILDTEEHKRLQADEDAYIQKVKSTLLLLFLVCMCVCAISSMHALVFGEYELCMCVCAISSMHALVFGEYELCMCVCAISSMHALVFGEYELASESVCESL